MEDHHVDRPGVEAQQCVKLTGTNSSIGLIVLIFAARLPFGKRDRPKRPTTSFQTSALRRPGGYCEEPEPDPIPNSAVKLLRANDTSSQDVGK